MEKNENVEYIEKMYFGSYVKCILLNNSVDEIVETYTNNDEDKISLLDSISFILDNEPLFIYYEQSLSTKLLTIISNVKNTNCDKREEIIEKSNDLIVKINGLNTDNFIQKQSELFALEAKNRYNKNYMPNYFERESFKRLLNELYTCDYLILQKVCENEDAFVNNDMLKVLSSINYLTKVHPMIFKEKPILYRIAVLNIIIKKYITTLNDMKILDKNSYKVYKKIEKSVITKLDEFANELDLPKNEIKKLEKGAKAVITVTPAKES